MSNNKTIKVFSSTAVAGMIAAAMMSSQAFAAVDAYSVKVGDQVYKYDKADLTKSFLNSKRQKDAKLYDDFVAKLTEAKGFYAFNDTKNGYVDFNSIQAKFKEAKRAGQEFNLDEFTESKDAKIVEVKALKKAVVNKDGNVEYVDEVKKDENADENSALKVTSVEPLSLKQVKINFNKAITDDDKKEDIEDEGNYTLKDKDNSEITDAIKEVKLDDDKKSATLTFKDKTDSNYKGINSYIIENQENYKLIIDDSITGEEIPAKLKFSDATLPEVKDVSVVGVDTIKVKFSEPIIPWNIKKLQEGNESPQLDPDDFNIYDSSDSDLNIRKVELVNDNKEANIILSSDLKDKEKIKVKIKASVRDYAGLSVIAGDAKAVEVKRDSKIPNVVGYKDVKDNKVTLIFDKDIKVKDSNSNEIVGSDLDKIYQSSDDVSNRAKSAVIDGKELKVEFKTDLGVGTTNIYIKSGIIESRWEVENEKISYRVSKNEDSTKPEVSKIEQDEDSNSKIKIKFSKKVNCESDTKDESATNKSNYTLKDNDGREISIRKITPDGNSEKKFIIETVKDLDDDKEYTLEVKDIEDKNGNAIEKTKKKFKAVDNDAVNEEDIKVKAYSVQTSDQKIVVDFDSTMKDDKSEYSAKDLSKYTLVYKGSNKEGLFDGKDSINLSKLYRANIKMAKNGKAVEISIPGKKDKKDLHDKQYNLLNEASGKNSGYELQINRVSDANNNVTDKNYTVPVDVFAQNQGEVTFDTNSDYVPQIVALDKIMFGFNDKVDFHEKDIKVVVANKDKSFKDIKTMAGIYEDEGKVKWSKEKVEEAIKKDEKGNITGVGEGVLDIANTRPRDNDDNGNTKVELTIDKIYKDKAYDDSDNNHIFTYDGHFMKRDANGKALKGEENKLNVYVVVVPSKNGVTETENDYDQTLKLADPVLVKDKLAPAIEDNGIRKDKEDKYVLKDDKDVNNKDKIVEYYYDANTDTGALVLSFEENIDENSIGTASIELNKDDFKDAKVTNVKVTGNKVTITLRDLIDTSKDISKEEYHKSIEVGSRFKLKSLKDTQDNEATDLSLEVGDFQKLDASKLEEGSEIKEIADLVAKAKQEVEKLPSLDKVELGTSVEEAQKAVEALKAKKVNVTEYQKVIDSVKTKAEELKAGAERAAREDATNKLSQKITEATTAHTDATEGEKVGNFIVGSKEELQNAITKAIGVKDAAESTTEQLKDATTELNNKLEAFNKAKVEKAKATTENITIDNQRSGSKGETTITLNDGETLELVGVKNEFATAEKEDSTGKVTVTSVANGSYDLTVQVKKDGKVIRTVNVKVTVSNQQ